MPEAYLITFRTYGTWLHGDQRGSMERRAFNTPGEPGRQPNPALQAAARKLMRHPPRSFGDGERAVVARAIAAIADHRDWTLLALAVRTEHVHVVICAEATPEEVMTALKAAATRALKRVGVVVDDERVWSRHGSTRYLWNRRAVDDAVRYVAEGQDGPKV